MPRVDVSIGEGEGVEEEGEDVGMRVRKDDDRECLLWAVGEECFKDVCGWEEVKSGG